ncbi:MAG: hypothetical protein ACQESH_03385 [Campylobacterota bacterium]
MGIMNYYHMTIVSGFFIGIVTAIINIERGPVTFVMVALAIPTFFYFIVHIAISVFIRYSEDTSIKFDKDNYEKAIDRYYNELLVKEKSIDESYEFTKNLEEEMGRLYRRQQKINKRKKRVANA